MAKVQVNKPIAYSDLTDDDKADLAKLSDKELESFLKENPIDYGDGKIVGGLPKVSQLEAAQIGAGQGISFGFRPVLKGVGGAIGSSLGTLLYSNKDLAERIPYAMSEGKKAYSESKQEALEEEAAAGEQFPKTTLGANVGSSLLTLPLTAARGLQGVQGAARLGAIQGLGKAASEAESLPEAIEDVGTGAALGLGAYGAGKLVEKGAGKVAGKVKEYANEKATEALNARKLFQKNIVKGNEQELGEFALETGIVKAGDNVKKIAEKADNAADELGDKIGELYEKVSKKIDPSSLAPEQVAALEANAVKGDVLREQLKKKVAASLKGEFGGAAALNKISAGIDEVIDADGILTPKDLHALLKKTGTLAYESKRAPQPDSVYQKGLDSLYGGLRETTDKNIEALDAILGTKDLSALKAMNKNFGKVADIRKITTDSAERLSANNKFSLGDKVLTGGALGAGSLADPATTLNAAAVGVASNLLRNRGKATLAKSADLAADAIRKSPELLDLARRNPVFIDILTDKIDEAKAANFNPMERKMNELNSQGGK